MCARRVLEIIREVLIHYTPVRGGVERSGGFPIGFDVSRVSKRATGMIGIGVSPVSGEQTNPDLSEDKRTSEHNNSGKNANTNPKGSTSTESNTSTTSNPSPIYIIQPTWDFTQAENPHAVKKCLEVNAETAET